MSDEYVVRKGEGENPVPASAYSIEKAPRGPPGLTSDVRIAINSTYAFTSYALRRYLGFNPIIFGTETSC
jgi:hypothetical protein